MVQHLASDLLGQLWVRATDLAYAQGGGRSWGRIAFPVLKKPEIGTEQIGGSLAVAESGQNALRGRGPGMMTLHYRFHIHTLQGWPCLLGCPPCSLGAGGKKIEQLQRAASSRLTLIDEIS
jgi:hypothetical protein